MKNLKPSLYTSYTTFTPPLHAGAVFTVSQLNEQIRKAVTTSFKNRIWVCGEIYRYDLDISKANTRSSRQIYFELVEQDTITKERKATISAVIWGDDRDIIEEKLKQSATGFVLRDGLQVKVQCYVDFYTPQGKVQLRVVDIDLEYTIGKIALERKQLLEKLIKLNLLDKNKKIPIPIVPINIGLITSFGSAAYNDFIDELKKSGYGFSVYLYDGKMQGSELERDVCKAISKLNELKNIDVIAIVRGGGSASDLMGFDKELVAIAIANSTKPVLTGIGHQIDRTVSDEVANMSFKTPTATAQFLVEKIENFQKKTENIFNRIIEKQKDIIFNTKK
ncbi:MAG: exodeoxyribonuclease VII large subunit [Elusimicrobiota bacterium]|nr:exodeoxyribonuclease VII large subunit [Elusimicrobiota bacterium]